MRYENCSRLPIEHKSGARTDSGTHPEVEKIDEGPADLLAHAWNGVDDDLPGEDENGVDEPCAWRTIQGPGQSRAGKARERRRTFAIHPLRVQVVIYALV